MSVTLVQKYISEGPLRGPEVYWEINMRPDNNPIKLYRGESGNHPDYP